MKRVSALEIDVSSDSDGPYDPYKPYKHYVPSPPKPSRRPPSQNFELRGVDEAPPLGEKKEVHDLFCSYNY